MAKAVDYYLVQASPYAYLGHQRFLDIVRKRGATMNMKVVDAGKIFPVSGGLPLAKRAPQRQAYRLMELKRWRDYLGVSFILQPKYFPVASDLAARAINAAVATDPAAAPDFALGVMRSIWAEERNIAEPEVIGAAARAAGLSADKILAAAQSPETAATYDRLTQEAIDRGVFGFPTFVYRDELFWGQDRLDFLDRALAKG